MHQNFRASGPRLWIAAFALILALGAVFLWTPVQANDTEVETETKAKGIVQEMPRLLFFGHWEVDGKKYEATLLTRFDQRDGPITEGACAEVRFSEASMPHRLTRVTALEEEECQSNDGDDDDGDMGDDDKKETPDDGEMPSEDGTVVIPAAKAYGRITQLPDSENWMGVWGVDDIDYYVNEHTSLKQLHGRFTLEACVKVKYGLTSDGLRVATQIKTSSDHRCNRNEDKKPYGVIYGVIQSVPESMINVSATGALVQAASDNKFGEYNIGGKTFIADENTKFIESRKAKIEIGVVAKVKFIIQDDETYLATKIQAIRKAPGHDMPKDDDDNGEDKDDDDNDGLRGNVFGEIESFPADLIGTWKVSGITFTTSAETSYIQRVQTFDRGVPVRVNYEVDAEGERMAKVVKSIRGRGNGSHKFCGYLNGRPANGFIGRWLVDNFEGITDLSTIYDESLGLIGNNAYVEVDYTVDENGKVTFNAIKAHVPPGAGDNDAIGPISRIVDEDDVQAASIAADQTWVIGDKTYVVTPATQIDESQGDLQLGERVSVNSYTAEDGSEVATSISRVAIGTIAPILYLPAIQ